MPTNGSRAPASGCVESRMRSSSAVGGSGARAALAASPAEDAAEQLGRQARAAHPEHGGATVAIGSRMSRARCSSSVTRPAIASGRSSQPSQAAISSGSLPEAAHSEPSFAHSRSATRSRGPGLEPRRDRRVELAHAGASSFRFDSIVLDQLVEALREADATPSAISSPVTRSMVMPLASTSRIACCAAVEVAVEGPLEDRRDRGRP